LTAAGDAFIDFETTPSYTLNVLASDGTGNSNTGVITVNLTSVGSGDAIAPELTAVTTNLAGTAVTLEYNETLSLTVPVPGAFSVTSAVSSIKLPASGSATPTNGVDVSSGDGDLFVSLTTGTANTVGHGTAAFDLGFTMSQAQTWNGVAGLKLEWNLSTGAFTSNNSSVASSAVVLGSYGSALSTFQSLAQYTLGAAQFSVLAFDPTGPGIAGTTGQSVMSTANIISATGIPTQPGASFGPTNGALASTFANTTVLNYNAAMNADSGMISTPVGSNTAVNGQNDHYNANSTMATMGGIYTGYDTNGLYGGQYAAGTNVFSGQDRALPFFQFYASSLATNSRTERVAFGVDLDADGIIEFDNNGATAGGSSEYGLWSLQGSVLSYTNPGSVGVVNVNSVTATGSSVVLNLAGSVGGLETTVTYTDPSPGNDANATQDVAGNDAASVTFALIQGSGGGDNFALGSDEIARLSGAGSAPQIARMDGAAGIDKITLTGSGLLLDLTTITATLDNIERIDLTGSGNNTLTLSMEDVLAIGSANTFNSGNTTGLAASEASFQIRVEGNTGDTLTLADLANWTASGTEAVADGRNYTVYNHNIAAAQLLIDQQIVVS
jgi:hypothetical protein